MADKAENDERNHDKALFHQPRVLNRTLFVQLHDRLHALGRDNHAAAVYDIIKSADDDHNNDTRRAGSHNEVREAEARLGADHDIRRVADEGRRAADIRGENLREQERHRVDAQNARNRNRHRADEQDGRDVIEEGAEHGGQDHEQQHDLPRAALRDLRRLDGHVLEQAGVAHDRNEQHHAEQHADRAEVDVADRFVYRQHAQAQKQHRAGNRRRRAVHLFRDERGHDDEKHHDRNNLHGIHK